MNNPHYKTYQFRDVTLGNGDTIRLKIRITINALGEDETIVSEEENVFITHLGEKEEVYDFDDLLLTPSFYSAAFTAIENGSFQKYFFDEDEAIFKDADKEAYVLLEIMYLNTTVWVEEFSGNIILDSLSFNPDTTEFNFEAAPDMTILSETMIFNINDRPLDPFNYHQQTFDGFYYNNVAASLTDQIMLRSASNRYTATYVQTLVKFKVTVNEPVTSGAIAIEVWKNGEAFGTGIICQIDQTTDLSVSVFTNISLAINDYIELKITTDSTYQPSTADLIAEVRTQGVLDAMQFYKPLKTILLDCYKLVNPNLTLSNLELEHDWQFYAEWINPEDPMTGGQVDDVSIDEVEIDIWPLFFDQSYGIVTIADLLKRLAQEFVCFTGMLTRNKVFFKKLFLSNPSTNILLDDESYYNYSKTYKFNKIEYVRINVVEAIGNGNYNYYTAHAPSESFATSLQDKFLEINTLTIGAVWANGYRATNIRCLREAEEFGILPHHIIGVRDPGFHYAPVSYIYFSIPGFPDVVPTNKLIADFWYRYKSTTKHLRVDPIITPGNHHSITKNILFKEKIFQLIAVTKKYKDCKSEIDGLIIQ